MGMNAGGPQPLCGSRSAASCRESTGSGRIGGIGESAASENWGSLPACSRPRRTWSGQPRANSRLRHSEQPQITNPTPVTPQPHENMAPVKTQAWKPAALITPCQPARKIMSFMGYKWSRTRIKTIFPLTLTQDSRGNFISRWAQKMMTTFSPK